MNRCKKLTCGALAGLMLMLVGCQPKVEAPKPTPTPKPQVTVEYGEAEPVTLDLQEGVPLNQYDREKYVKDEETGRITYTDSNYTVMTGIDVSEHQQAIDWNLIAEDGIDFAMIRLGYRGSSEGMLYADPYFHSNIRKAVAAGLDVGVYFFSQATSRAEAVAEAYFVTSMLEEYRDSITMPVVFDWEETSGENSRSKGLSGETVTLCAQHFTRIIREEGYEPAVYFNRHMGYYLYDLTQLPDVEFWFAGEGDYSDFYYNHSMWQYTFTGRADGIAGNVDLNLYMKPNTPEPQPEEETDSTTYTDAAEAGEPAGTPDSTAEPSDNAEGAAEADNAASAEGAEPDSTPADSDASAEDSAA